MPATESNLRDLKKVHVIFALSAIVLFVVTVWMMEWDHRREWVGYQRTFEDIQTHKQNSAIKSIEESPQYKTSEAELLAQQKAAQERLDAVAPEKNKLASQLVEAERQYDAVSRQVRNARAFRDKARADFDLGVRDEVSA